MPVGCLEGRDAEASNWSAHHSHLKLSQLQYAEYEQALPWNSSNLRVAVLSPSPPPKKKVKRKRGKVYANLTPIVFRNVTLTYAINGIWWYFFCEAARVSLKVTEIKQQYWSEFIFRFSGKFAI